MAISKSSLPQKRNLYTLSTLSLLLLFLFCLFLFTKRALEPNLSLYRDLIPLKPTPVLHSPPRSIENNDDLAQIVIPSENVDNNTSLSSGLSESGFQGGNNEEKEVPVSSKSDLDDNFNEISGKPISSNEKLAGPISSNENLDDDSKSSLDDKNRGELNKSSDNIVSSDGEPERVISNAVAEKLRSCDIHKGKWVRDEDYPLYRPGSCPYVDGGFDCQSNGRPDSEYLKWRWKPDECDLPRFWSF